VWSRNLKNEEAMAQWGLLCPPQKTNTILYPVGHDGTPRWRKQSIPVSDYLHFNNVISVGNKQFFGAYPTFFPLPLPYFSVFILDPVLEDSDALRGSPQSTQNIARLQAAPYSCLAAGLSSQFHVSIHRRSVDTSLRVIINPYPAKVENMVSS